MDGLPLPSDDGISWFYLDSVQKEFGPFPNDMMREWFMQGFFPLGEELLIRLPHWKQHVPLKVVYPEVQDAFLGLPGLLQGGSPPLAQVPAQVETYAPSFDTSVPPYADPGLMGRRQVEETLPLYPAPAPAQMGGGYWMMSPGGNGSPTAGAHASSLGGAMPAGGGLPAHLGGLPGSMHGGVPGALPGSPMLGGMPGSGLVPGGGGVEPGMPPLGGMPLTGMQGHPSGMPGGLPDAAHHSHMLEAMLPRRGSMPDSFQGCHPGLGAVGGIGQPGLLPQQHRPLPMQPQQHQQPCASTHHPSLPQGLANERFRGRIKSFNAKQGFGFIENPDAYAIFGRDVFLHKAQIGNLKVGTEVTYGVDMNKQGMPQARDLVTLDGQAPGPPPPNVAKGGGKTKVARGRARNGKDDSPEGGNAGRRADNRNRTGKGAQKGGAQPQATMPGLLPDPAALGVHGGLSVGVVGAR